MTYHQGHHPLAVVDSPLAAAPAGLSAAPPAVQRESAATGPAVVGDALAIRIDNFAFTPGELRVAKDGKVTWINGDDVPHLIASADNRFKPSPVLDTNEHYTLTFDRPGSYPCYCSIHRK